MKRGFIACGFLVLTASLTTGQEIGFVEEFSLSGDRAAALSKLIPGTEDYYFYQCLHAQNLEQYDRVEELLRAWIKRHNYTERVREILHRQALLTYDQTPQKTLAYLRKELRLRFNHQRERLGQKPNLPVALNQALISRQRLLAGALALLVGVSVPMVGGLALMVGALSAHGWSS